MSSFAEDVIVYVKDPKHLQEKVTRSKDICSEITSYKTSMDKSTLFLYPSHDCIKK